MKLGGNLPVWIREKRQPTKAELAGKHVADGGGMGTSGPGNTLPDDEPTGAEYELVPLSESSPNILVRRAKEAPPSTIKIRKKFS